MDKVVILARVSTQAQDYQRQVFESTLRDELQVYQKESLDERKRLKKMLTEADNEIKNMKVRYATGKIDEDIYEVAIREMQNRKDVLTLELEKCNDNLSNLEAQIPVVISTACKLGTLWHDGNLETKRKIHNLVYPNGIYWDKTKRCYRTQNRNKFFDILDRYSISYGKEKGTSSSEDVPLCGLWVTTKEHQTRVQTFPIFPKGFQVLT